MYDAKLSVFIITCSGHQTLKVIRLTLLFLFATSVIAQSYATADEDDLPYVEIQSSRDFQALGRQAKHENKIIFLEVSASYCGYCKTLEEHIIKPMLRSGDYDHYVLFRKIEIDSYLSIKDFDGEKTSPSQFALKRKASLTPTLLFIDSNGQEVSERIVGVNTLELYGGYVDEALLKGHQKIQQN